MPDHNNPRFFSFDTYSALMGLLCSSGANLAKGPNNWHYPRSTILKISSTNLVFLQ